MRGVFITRLFLIGLLSFLYASTLSASCGKFLAEHPFFEDKLGFSNGKFFCLKNKEYKDCDLKNDPFFVSIEGFEYYISQSEKNKNKLYVGAFRDRKHSDGKFYSEYFVEPEFIELNVFNSKDTCKVESVKAMEYEGEADGVDPDPETGDVYEVWAEYIDGDSDYSCSNIDNSIYKRLDEESNLKLFKGICKYLGFKTNPQKTPKPKKQAQ